ncbi:hypothetical protein Ciccas_004812, partial [Cichlidogyrus casuarinus]
MPLLLNIIDVGLVYCIRGRMDIEKGDAVLNFLKIAYLLAMINYLSLTFSTRIRIFCTNAEEYSNHNVNGDVRYGLRPNKRRETNQIVKCTEERW